MVLSSFIPGASKNILLVSDEGVAVFNSNGKKLSIIANFPWSTPDFEETMKKKDLQDRYLDELLREEAQGKTSDDAMIEAIEKAIGETQIAFLMLVFLIRLECLNSACLFLFLITQLDPLCRSRSKILVKTLMQRT